MSSPTLCNLIGAEDFAKLANLKEAEIRLFQCFLDTQLMICQPENPNPLRADEDVLELVPGGGHRRRNLRGKVKTVDPLHQLFVLDDPKQTGEWIDVIIHYNFTGIVISIYHPMSSKKA